MGHFLYGQLKQCHGVFAVRFDNIICSDALESKRELNTVKSSSSCCYTFYTGVLVGQSEAPNHQGTREQGTGTPKLHSGLPCLCPHAAGRASSTLPMTLKGTADKKRGGTFGQHCFED